MVDLNRTSVKSPETPRANGTLRQYLDDAYGNQSRSRENRVGLAGITEDFCLELPPRTTSEDVFGKILEYQSERGLKYQGRRLGHQFGKEDNGKVEELISYIFVSNTSKTNPRVLVTVLKI